MAIRKPDRAALPGDHPNGADRAAVPFRQNVRPDGSPVRGNSRAGAGPTVFFSGAQAGRSRLRRNPLTSGDDLVRLLPSMPGARRSKRARPESTPPRERAGQAAASHGDIPGASHLPQTAARRCARTSSEPARVRGTSASRSLSSPDLDAGARVLSSGP